MWAIIGKHFSALSSTGFCTCDSQIYSQFRTQRTHNDFIRFLLRTNLTAHLMVMCAGEQKYHVGGRMHKLVCACPKNHACFITGSERLVLRKPTLLSTVLLYHACTYLPTEGIWYEERGRRISHWQFTKLHFCFFLRRTDSCGSSTALRQSDSRLICLFHFRCHSICVLSRTFLTSTDKKYL